MDFRNLTEAMRFSAEKYQKVSLLDTAQSALDVYCLMPGQSQKLHSHKETDKYYVIWEGRGTVQIGQEVRELGPGEAALARPGVEHSIANHGTAPLIALVFQSPRSH